MSNKEKLGSGKKLCEELRMELVISLVYEDEIQQLIPGPPGVVQQGALDPPFQEGVNIRAQCFIEFKPGSNGANWTLGIGLCHLVERIVRY